MSVDKPDHHDAEVAMKVYDLRREPVMRESRSTINARFWPRSYEDLAAVMTPDNPLNAPFRQVSTYWEMVYGMVKWGIVHPGYFLESNAEGLFLYAKVAPFVEVYRREYSATAFRNAEWVAGECPEGKRLFEQIAARVRKIAESR
jgi:hypothetical protein